MNDELEQVKVWIDKACVIAAKKINDEMDDWVLNHLSDEAEQQ